MSQTTKTLSQRADELEEQQLREFEERIVAKSLLFNLADGERSTGASAQPGPGRYYQMGEDPRLPAMPDKPTLFDFYRCRFAERPGIQHVLQSANLAQKKGLPEKIVLACLLHDIAVTGFIRSDHGYWGAQLVEPYVDEEISWAIRTHQALRFYADESVGYAYPEQYIKFFGADYKPEPYIEAEYQRAKNHKWYMTSRMICVNDLYSFDPEVKVTMEQFEDVVGRHFRTPREGLGNDNTASSHMWRTLRRPCNAL
jgi:hypothetical protein